MNGEMVNFPVNGTQAAGYLAEAQLGKGTGVLVLQEWLSSPLELMRMATSHMLDPSAFCTHKLIN